MSSEVTIMLDKRRELEMLKRRNELRKQNGMLCYKPHSKQELFHSLGNKKYRYVRTGNRFGKSDMGAFEDAAWAIGARLWLDPSDPNYGKGIPKRATKGLIVAIDWDKCEEIFTNMDDGLGRGKMWKALPRDHVMHQHRNHSGRIDKIVVKSIHGGRSTIYFDTVQSFQKNEMSQESSNWDWVHFDEPIPEAMWKGIARGLVDADGSAWFCCTPLNQPWINDFFLPNVMWPLDPDEINFFGEDKAVIVGAMRDNPYLTESAIASYEMTLTEDEKQCRINGIPLAMAGMVYKEFDHNRHVIRDIPTGWRAINDPPENYSIYFAIDPHPRTPHAVLFAAVAPTGEVFFFEELFEATYIKDLSEEIKKILVGRNLVKGICDPLAYIANPIDGTTMADEFFKQGVFFEKATKELSHGILETKKALAQDHNLYFAESLYRTIWELEHYTWDSKKPNSPIDKDDHMMECLYRLVLTELYYVEPDKDSPKYFSQPTISRLEVDEDYDHLESYGKQSAFAERYPA
jgi:hypothetical protein